MSYAQTDTDRRLANVVQIGRIVAVDPANGLAQVDLGGPSTDWVQWTTSRAGGDRTYWAPEVGEQVVVAAPSGDLGNGVIIGSLFQDAYPEPADSADVSRTVYADGTVIEYDRSAHQYKIDVSASSGSVLVICKTASVQAQESVTLDAPDTIVTGTMTVQGLLTYQDGIAGSGGGNGNAITGGIAVTGGDVTADTISLKSHVHSGIQSGGGNTDVPVP